MLFTFPSRYWFTIGRQVVLSLGGWSPQIPTRFHVPRGTREHPRGFTDFAYGAITLFGRPFQTVPLSDQLPHRSPTTPTGIASRRFGLIPFRSPLLGESRLISVPPGTEMFQFSGLAPFRVTSLAACRVSPFGHSGITVRVQLPRTYRSLPRPSSPLDAKASTVCLIAFDLNSFVVRC